MYHALETHLLLALIANKPDKAARKKAIIKLLKKVEPHLQHALIIPVLDSKQPIKTIFDNIGWFQEQESAAREISELGCVGMVIHNNIAYPVEAIPHSEYERAWMIANEERLANTAAALLARGEGVEGETVTVAFLSNRGFSGTRYRIVANKELQ